VDTLSRNTNQMTGAERQAELYALLRNTAEIDFETIHPRIEALVGRPVFNPEGALNSARLLEEAGEDRAPAPFEMD
jgi:hypothetical protein